MKKTPTISVLIHRARARYPYVVTPMADVLAFAGVSAQWWSRLRHGTIENPCPDRMRALAAVCGASPKEITDAYEVTKRRAKAGKKV